ncbi:hypothetical protein [Actinomadura sp. 3N407]|uniref:hypothetical protein n=1 Tax=Actinomadura sp. 3N407 TaxID=3457423 RepID=UPI003FCECE21
MRSRHPLRIAAAALLAFATALPLAATAQAAQPTAAAGGVLYKKINSGVSPSWYTPEFERRLLASGTDGVRLPADATLPGGVTAPQAAGLVQPGIRPGQWLLTLLGSDGSDNLLGWCSANFVFKKNSTWGLGTAGHCGVVGQPVSAYVVPPPASGKLPGLYVIGKISLSRDHGIGDDFAMITISPEFSSWMNPTMPVWGGPAGVHTGDQVGEPLKHFGHGTLIGTGGTPRVGAALRWDIENGAGYSWAGAATPGDSGSGVLTLSGQAAGDLTHIVADVEGNMIGVAGTRMTKILQVAQGWTLVNGSLLPL